MSILGNRVVRKEDPKLLTVGGSYVDDLKLPGAVHAAVVRSTMAHARITVDASEARNAPGVIGVYTADDVPLGPFPPDIPMINAAMGQPVLASGKVRYVGEAVAVVVTEEKYQGEDAAELVFVDYDPLPPVIDFDDALKDETLLFEEAGTNVAVALNFGSADDFFDGCDVIVKETALNQRVAPCPMEVRCAAAQVGDDGRLTIWLSNQAAHSAHGGLVGLLQLEDPTSLRVIAPDVGGGFGAKGGIYPEDVLVGWLAQQLKRPVKWVESRSESMLTMGHGRAQRQVIEIGADNEGKVLAYRLTLVQDAGAYGRIGAFLAFFTRNLSSGVYAIPKIECNATAIVTNTTPTLAYRGAGRPEATAAIERAMDLLADKLGMDPGEVRRRNLIPKDAFPYTTAVGTTYDSGDYEKALDLVIESSDYAALRAEQKRRREANDPVAMGIGLSIYVEITNPIPGAEFGAVEIKPDGKAIIRAGTSSHGQGHATAFAMIASEKLGIPIDDIELVQADTDLVPRGHGTMGSRSLQTGGVAVSQASTQALEIAKQLAADLLEASVDDVVLDKIDGKFHVAGTPARAKTWAEIATAAAEKGEHVGANGGLGVEVDFMPPGPSFPFGAHVAVVDVDTETGKVVLTRFVAVDDCGLILNPLLAEGQRHGGIAQGVAQALLEEVLYDEDGNPRTGNLADYAMISAPDLPSFDLVPMETATPNNELGAKGIGESGTIGSTPAVQSAVIDALKPFGISHLDMPASPERVWRAIQAARA